MHVVEVRSLIRFCHNSYSDNVVCGIFPNTVYYVISGCYVFHGKTLVSTGATVDIARADVLKALMLAAEYRKLPVANVRSLICFCRSHNKVHIQAMYCVG